MKVVGCRFLTRFSPALFAILAMTLLLSGGTPALAVCSNTNPADGETVTCTGTETNPVGTGAEKNVTVNIQPGASITVGADTVAIALQDLNRINNLGSIIAGDATALASGGILLSGDDNIVTNSGTIIVGNVVGGIQVFGIQTFGNGNLITNNGIITVGNGDIFPPNASGISVQDNSQVINNDTIITGDNSVGILSCCNNVITNSARALIQSGNDSYGIFASDLATIVNAGRIAVGNSSDPLTRSYGIVVAGSDNSVTNTGNITAGTLSAGMGIDDSVFGPFGGGQTGNILTNAAGGVIQVGNGSFGIAAGTPFAPPTSATLINNGTIIAGDAVSFVSPSVGIVAFGPANIINTGNITVGNGDFFTPTIGIFAGEDGSVIQNSGTITAGTFGTGISAGGDNSTLNNSGTIIVGAGGIGIHVQIPLSGPAFGPGIAITNSGTVITNGGTGIHFDDLATLNNTGTIRATGLGSRALNTCCGAGFVTNAGTIDGEISLSFGSTLTNNGLITITDSDAINPVGVVHIGGDAFVQNAGGVLALRVTSDGRSDSMGVSNVLATVTLGGTLRALVQPGLYGNTTTYLGVVTSGANIVGQFGTVQSSSPFLTALATYNPQTVDLTLTRVPFNAVPGLTPNQFAVASALERAYSPAVTGNAATIYANLFAFGTPATFDQLSGQGYAAAQNATFNAGALFTNSMLNPGTSFVFQPTAYAAANPTPRGHEAFAALKATPGIEQPGRWRLWMLGFGSRQTLDGELNPGAADQTVSTAGGSFGADHRFANGFVLGFAVGGSSSKFSVPNLFTNGDITGAHLGAYMYKAWGAFYAAGSVSYGRFDNDATRTTVALGLAQTATANFDSDLLAGRFEVGWRLAYKQFQITLFAAVQPAMLRQHSFAETTAGILGLIFPSQTTHSLPTFVGAQFETSYAVWQGAIFSPYLRASWVHEFEPNRNIQATLVAIPTAGFTVGGARPARDAARIEAGGKLALRENVGLFTNFNAELSGQSTSYGLSGGIRALW